MSWVGRTGDGYRYDYLHVGPLLAKVIHGCAYLPETRERKLTDHSAVTLTLNATATRLDTSDPTTAAETSTLAMF